MSTDLWLSPCGHLSARIDQWPEDEFTWPPSKVPLDVPDVIHPRLLFKEQPPKADPASSTGSSCPHHHG